MWGVVRGYDFMETLKWMDSVGFFTAGDIAKFWGVRYKVAWDRLYRLRKKRFIDKVSDGCYTLSALGKLWLCTIKS